MALVDSTRVRHAQHVDIGQVGIVGRDVALQLAHNRVMRLIWVGERIGRMCLSHARNYADCSKWLRMPANIATCASTAWRRVIAASARGAAIYSRSVRRVPTSVGSNVTTPRSRTWGNWRASVSTSPCTGTSTRAQ